MADDTAVDDREVEHYRTWIGRRTTAEDGVSKNVIERFAAAVDRDMPADGLVPQMWHYGLFLDATPTAQLGADGHSPRGGAMPPVRLPRRMFAGSEIQFLSPLRIEVPARRVSEILSVDRRKGSSGDLILVRISDTISQNDALCIKEVRTIVYLGAGRRIEPVTPEPHFKAKADEGIWTPDSIALFRFSAVTFNTHRIHYDLPYATETEGYPGLVVNGPLTALRLCDFAGRRRNAQLSYFSFRGEAPLFCGQPIALSLDPAGEDDIAAA